MRSIARILVLTGLLFGTAFSHAADIVGVKGESTYYDNGTHSKMECMRLALEQARIDALAREFGTLVSQDILQTDRISGSREHNDFLSLSSTEVKGEWIADDGEPEYEFSHDAEANLIVKCRVRGKAREISNESANFKAVVLRNGTSELNADNRFRDGDSMYLLFKGACDGYMAAFLQDEGGHVFQLLPYPGDAKSRVPVKNGRDYLFFSADKAARGEPVEEILLTAPYAVEYNRVYVIFSPEPFSRPVMTHDPGSLPVMDTPDFSKWLVKTRRADPKMGMKVINVEIAPK